MTINRITNDVRAEFHGHLFRALSNDSAPAGKLMRERGIVRASFIRGIAKQHGIDSLDSRQLHTVVHAMTQLFGRTLELENTKKKRTGTGDRVRWLARQLLVLADPMELDSHKREVMAKLREFAASGAPHHESRPLLESSELQAQNGSQ